MSDDRTGTSTPLHRPRPQRWLFLLGLGILLQLGAAPHASETQTGPRIGMPAIESDPRAQPSSDEPSGPMIAQDAGAAGGAVPAFGIYGSNTIGASLMPALLDGYAAQIGVRAISLVGNDPEEVQLHLAAASGLLLARIDLRSHGSATAFPALASGKAAIGMSSRRIKPDEAHALQSIISGGNMYDRDHEHVLGLDGVLVLVSPDNPLKSLTIDQIAEIFSGQVTDWSQIRQTPGAINIYARDSKSGTFDTFQSLVLGTRKLAAGAKRFESSEELSDEVARDPNGIGFVGFAYLRNAKALAIDSPCGITSRATAMNVKTEEYPLSRRLYLYTADMTDHTPAANIVDYALSERAQPIVRAQGFVDQSLEYLNAEDQLARLDRLIAEPAPPFDASLSKQLALRLRGTIRISSTFRFRSDSAELDSRAGVDVRRLAEFARFIDDPAHHQGRTLILAGFSDSMGSPTNNAALSLARARQVRDAVIAAMGKQPAAGTLEVEGFGRLLPVACNDTLEGRERNRRVEVWLRAQ